jgi:hypothetical protein
MSAIVPFEFNQTAVALNRRRENSINQEAMIGKAGFPVLSIKGKVFTLVKDSVRKVLEREIEGEMIPRSSIDLAVLRANTKSRVFYGKSYVEGDSDGEKPKCFSNDGVAPDPQSAEKQAAKCAVCPHAVWGSKASTDGREAKGTACAPNIRLAVAAPDAPDTAFLLRVPPASRTSFSDAVKLVDVHGKDYNEVVFRVSFDKEAATPKLQFKPVGLLADDVLAKAKARFEDEVVVDIVGLTPAAAPAAAPAPTPQLPLTTYQGGDEEDDAPAPAPAPTPAPAPEPAKRTRAKATPAPAPAPKPPADDEDDAGGDDLVGSLNALLSGTDD